MNDSLRIAGLFPGQGSQSIGMGHEFFEGFDKAKEMFRIADEVLGFPLSEICFQGPADRLMETEVTQPAILTVSCIAFTLASENASGDFTTVAAAGHSLGEYSALVAAGALKFEDAVLLVHKRGKFMQEAVPLGQGRMVAVLGKEIGEIEKALQGVGGVAQIANVNAPGQIVVAGSAEGVQEFVDSLPGAKVKELPVSAPFHCALMEPAEKRLAEELEKVEISACTFPVYANYSAQAVTEPDAIRASLISQVCGRVRWVECMQNLEHDTQPDRAVEFGSGKVLSGLLRRISPELGRVNLAAPGDLEQAFVT